MGILSKMIETAKVTAEVASNGLRKFGYQSYIKAKKASETVADEITPAAVKKAKAVQQEFVSPFDAPDDDDRYFVEHYKDEKAAVDGVKRWNPHQFPWQSSSSILPPIFRFSHTLALIASYWGPDFVWVIVLYCGYKLRKLLEKMPLLALVTICMVIVSLFLATQ